MAHTDRPDDVLRKIVPHLYYETAMLKGTMELLKTREMENDVHSNALIESFTIHARVLMHFLYPRAQKPDDVLAADFFAVGYWEKHWPKSPEQFNDARERVNKEIAHLTYDRLSVTPELKRWDVEPLGEAILKVMDDFVSKLPQHLRDTYCGTPQMRAKIVRGATAYTTQDIPPTQ